MNGARIQPIVEREDYTGLQVAGLTLALLILFGLGIYWLGEGQRLGGAAALIQEDRIARGEKTYAAQCAACHGNSGEGGVGAALNNRKVLKNTSDTVFFSVVRSGVPNTQMPSWSVDFGGPLTDEEIRDVVAFMRAWEPTAPEILPAAARPADPAQGALLFASTCVVCHGEDGRGGNPGIPALNDAARLGSFGDDWYRSVIANGRPARGMPTWGTVLSPAQIDDLVALIGAWRAGKAVQPAYSVTQLLDQARFALSQDDPASAQLHLKRAIEVSQGQAASLLQSILAQIQAGEVKGAAQALADLKQNWPPGDPQTGNQLFLAQCAACHGQQGEGGVGLPLHNSAFVQGQTSADLLHFIQTGRPGTAMAGFADRLTEQQIADIIAWLRTLQP